MDEWGIPEWRDPAGYRASGWTRNRWRWEFLRRRDDLRMEFDEKAEGVYRQKLEFFAICPEAFPDGRVLAPTDPGFFVSTRSIGQELQKLPNPRIGSQPFFAISWTDWPEAWRQLCSGIPPEGYARFDFDLRKPIEPQLDIAKQALKERQIEKFGKPIQKRRHPTKWLTYLRILDGRAAGASWSDLTSILPSRNGTEQAARDAWQQADALRFNF